MKLIKDDKRGYIHNDTLESLLIAKINGILLKEPETTKHLHETIQKRQQGIKRKASEISQPTLIPSGEEIKEEIISETKSDDGKESIMQKLKKIKLNDDDVPKSQEKESISLITKFISKT